MSEAAREVVESVEQDLASAGWQGARLVARGGVVTTAIPLVPNAQNLERLAAAFRFEEAGAPSFAG